MFVQVKGYGLMTDKKENENSLDSYTLDELKSVSLPTNLALHAHPIQVEEGKSEYSKTMENLGEVVSELNRRLGDEKCAFGGSMAMYLLWNNLMKEDSSIDIKDRLNERIRGGKNDYDLMLESGRKNSVMEKLGFKDSDMKLERGLVANHAITIIKSVSRATLLDFTISIMGTATHLTVCMIKKKQNTILKQT